MPPRIYLAGPDVFYPDPLKESERLKKVCADQGLTGVFPMDAGLDLSGLNKQEAARAIYDANIQLIHSAHGLIANMEAFRGPGMDGGTAFEIGYAKALGIPVVGYNYNGLYLERCRQQFGSLKQQGPNEVDPEGLTVEDFDLVDNLMMACGADVLVQTAEEAVAEIKRLCAAG